MPKQYQVYNLWPMLQATFDTEEEATRYMKELATYHDCLVVTQPRQGYISRAMHTAMTDKGLYVMKEVTTNDD